MGCYGDEGAASAEVLQKCASMSEPPAQLKAVLKLLAVSSLLKILVRTNSSDTFPRILFKLQERARSPTVRISGRTARPLLGQVLLSKLAFFVR